MSGWVRVVTDAEPIEASPLMAPEMADQVADAIGAPHSAVLACAYQRHAGGHGGILTISIDVPEVIEP